MMTLPVTKTRETRWGCLVIDRQGMCPILTPLTSVTVDTGKSSETTDDGSDQQDVGVDWQESRDVQY
jgi:hypothetical protein